MNFNSKLQAIKSILDRVRGPETIEVDVNNVKIQIANPSRIYNAIGLVEAKEIVEAIMQLGADAVTKDMKIAAKPEPKNGMRLKSVYNGQKGFLLVGEVQKKYARSFTYPLTGPYTVVFTDDGDAGATYPTAFSLWSEWELDKD